MIVLVMVLFFALTGVNIIKHKKSIGVIFTLVATDAIAIPVTMKVVLPAVMQYVIPVCNYNRQ